MVESSDKIWSILNKVSYRLIKKGKEKERHCTKRCVDYKLHSIIILYNPDEIAGIHSQLYLKKQMHR